MLTGFWSHSEISAISVLFFLSPARDSITALISRAMIALRFLRFCPPHTDASLLTGCVTNRRHAPVFTATSLVCACGTCTRLITIWHCWSRSASALLPPVRNCEAHADTNNRPFRKNGFAHAGGVDCAGTTARDSRFGAGTFGSGDTHAAGDPVRTDEPVSLEAQGKSRTDFAR